MKKHMRQWACALIVVFCLLSPRLGAQQPDSRVTLGIKPDYWFSSKGNGVRAKDLVKGGTAEKAGLMAGDIIVGLNDKKITNIFNYRDKLLTFERGDSVRVLVLRGERKLLFRTQFSK